jgi:hypothetical protein
MSSVVFLNPLNVCFLISTTHVATLALGSWPKQGVARLRAKKETRESHHMFPGVRRVWGNEPSHFQMNPHCGSWNPKWTLEFSEHNCRGQTHRLEKNIYIIGKLLKHRCLKWAWIFHLKSETQVMIKRKAESKIGKIWLSTTKSQELTWFPRV